MIKSLSNIFGKKKKIAVLMGGPSSEHEVSLWSGKMVVKHLDRRTYQVEPIVITKDNEWPIKPKDLDCDVAFIAMHGEYGEDGRVQSLLQKHKIPYTGSDHKASKLAMDKARTSKALEKVGLTSPSFVTFRKGNMRVNWNNLLKLGLPVVVKPVDLGSSVGTSIVRTIGKLAPAINDALQHSNKVMIQKYIKGREFTCSVVEQKGRVAALPPTEIIPKKQKFFDFKAKYTPGASKEITPPNLPKELIELIQGKAVLAHQSLGCSSYSRVDFLMDKDNRVYFLEVNTLPGLTKTSLLPQAAKKAGIDFSKILDIIIGNARN